MRVMLPMNNLVVTHVGPDVEGIGGMETVLRTYRDLPWSSMEVAILPSWIRGSVLGQLRVALRTARALQQIRRSRGTSITHVHVSHRGSFLREGAMVLLASAMSNRVFVTIHGSQFVATSKHPLWRRVYRLVLDRAQGIAVLNGQALEAVRQLGTRRPTTILANPGPVDFSRRAPRPPGEAHQIVVFAGAVGRRKGVDVLLDAWPQIQTRFPDAKLQIIGPLVDSDLEVRAAPHLLGSKSSADVLSYLANARLAVLPSRAEGMPMFLLEAMGMGRPIVVSNVGAMPLLAEGAGRVVPVGDSDALAEAIGLYLADAERADTDGRTASARYAQEYGHETVERRIRDFYALQ
jgi:glycosyltransferase involved in cell wall biosynthesis